MCRALSPVPALAAVLMLVSQNAYAQDELPPDEVPTDAVPVTGPPPGSPPSPRAKAGPRRRSPRARPRPRPRRAHFSRYRTNWYIGCGLGAGSGWFSANDSFSAAEGGAEILLKIGAVLRPWLLVGADLSFWVAPRYKGSDTTVMFSHYDALATVFPLFDLGLYVKGGLGVGSTVFSSEAYGTDRSDTGFDLKLGGGWEFQVGERITIGADLTYALTATKEITTHDVGLAGTISWY